MFAHVPDASTNAAKECCVQFFQEDEGMAAILRKEDADRLGINSLFESKMISLMVHSSLDAVGFLATKTGKLAAAGVSVNRVSAFYHDHLFVPVDKDEMAMSLLREFSSS
ncbi:MAG: hypothetical protein RIS36_1686 [Pseudomonadota bacterium]